MAYYNGQGNTQYYTPPPGPPPQHLLYNQYATQSRPPPQNYQNTQYAPTYQQPPQQYQQYNASQQPPPYQYQQTSAQYQQQPQQPQRPPKQHHAGHGGNTGAYHPRTGLTDLPPRFSVWNHVSSTSSFLQLGPQAKGHVLYSVKISSGSKTKIKQGQYNESMPSIIEARAKNMFSSKSLISFEGQETVLDGTSGTSLSSARWPLGLPVRGRPESYEWRKKKNPDASIMKKLFSGSGLGTWELCPAGSPPGTQPVATWTTHGASSNWLVDGAELGVFEFHGPAASGAMGDQATAVAVAAMMHIVHIFIIEKAASMAASAVG